MFLEDSVRDLVQKFAPTTLPILLLGPSGSGKSTLAAQIHTQSGRKGPFISVNCAAIAEHLAESELFGHKRGAFTGAVKDHDGFLTQADKGTLFLDEIAELKPEIQAKLLLVLEGKPYQKLGGTEEERPDFRLISATKQDLYALVRLDKFRDDLFYRIAACTMELAPLLERSNRLEFAEELANRICKQDGAILREVRLALERLFSHPRCWPGGVRELEHFIRVAAIDAQYAEWSKRQEWSRMVPTSTMSTSTPNQTVTTGDNTTPPTPGLFDMVSKRRTIEEREQYAALIRACLPVPSSRPSKTKHDTRSLGETSSTTNSSNVPSRRPIFQTEKGSRALANLLLDDPSKHVVIQEIQQVLGLADARPTQEVVAALVRDGLVYDRGNGVVPIWPPAAVTLYRRIEGGWLPVLPDQPTHGRTGDRFRVQVETRVRRRLIVGIVTHRWEDETNLGNEFPSVQELASLTIDPKVKPARVPFELEPPPGCVQLLVHLSPATH